MISAIALALGLSAHPGLPPCRFRGAPRDWSTQALTAWDRLDDTQLKMSRPVTPTVTFFDNRCLYRLVPDRRGDYRVGRRRYRSSAMTHSGDIPLPDGSSIPAGPTAFASPTSDGGMFFIMALPELWQTRASTAAERHRLSMVVFMHEFAHTQQAAGLGHRINSMLKRGLPADATDDVIQQRFAGVPGYTEAWASERDLFYQSANAPDAATARSRLATAAQAMKARRERWFTGTQSVYREADDVFLTLEGTGNWAAWAWLTDRSGADMDPASATAFLRGAGTYWSQDQGLAVTLALSQLIPEWPRLAFGPQGITADMLIAWAIQDDQ